MKRCELCKSTARIYCDSDRASLCWCCDAKVHSANFLVARHSRSLLCQVCQSPTSWSATGEKLWPSTASICGRCVLEGISDDGDDTEERVGGNDSEIGTDDNGDETELEDSVDENDNQVVPWSSTPLPPAASSSSSEECLTGDVGVMLKRKRQNVADLTSEDELDSSSVNITHHTPSSVMLEPATRKETASFHSKLSSSEGTVGDIKKLRHRETRSGENISAPLLGWGKSTRIAELDLNTSDTP